MKFIKRVILFVLLIFQFESCGNHIRNNFPEQIQANKEISIPPNYGKKPYVLLVIVDKPTRYEDLVKESVKSSYYGPVDFPKIDVNVTRTRGVGISNPNGSYSGYSCNKYEFNKRYSDLSRYRYVFDLEWFGVAVGSGSTTKWQAFIYDRVDDKYYSFPGRTAYYDELIMAYMGELEKVRYK